MRKVTIAAVTGLLCVGVAAATFGASAGVHSQTVTATRTPAVDLPTSTDTPAATITATATPIATATATPPSRTANQDERAGEDDAGNSPCQKHLTSSHGETGGNHCGQQKHGEDAAHTSDRSAMDDESDSE